MESENRSIAENAYLIGKADDLLHKLMKAFEATGIDHEEYYDPLNILRSLCDVKIMELAGR